MDTIQHLRADDDGNTPSVMARAEGHEELAEMLLGFERKHTTNADTGI